MYVFSNDGDQTVQIFYRIVCLSISVKYMYISLDSTCAESTVQVVASDI